MLFFYRRLLFYSIVNEWERVTRRNATPVHLQVFKMGSKPRWACSSCGMYSGRKYNVKRHIISMHNGLANIVSFIDYLAHRKQATYYFPNPIPSYLPKQQFQPQISTAPRPTEILKDELFRTALRKRLGIY